jgi:hypothetical protein
MSLHPGTEVLGLDPGIPSGWSGGLRAHANAPHKPDARWKTLRPLNHPGRARTVRRLDQPRVQPEDLRAQVQRHYNPYRS